MNTKQFSLIHNELAKTRGKLEAFAFNIFSQWLTLRFGNATCTCTYMYILTYYYIVMCVCVCVCVYVCVQLTIPSDNDPMSLMREI